MSRYQVFAFVPVNGIVELDGEPTDADVLAALEALDFDELLNSDGRLELVDVIELPEDAK